MTNRLLLTGSPSVEWDGESLAVPFERRHQLLVFLAAKRAWVTRAELAAMLWPDQPDKLAFTNLRKTLFRLQSVPWGASVESQGGALRCEVDTDLHAFDEAVREQRLADALGLLRGDFLVGYDDEASETWTSWLHFERERLRAAWRAAAFGRLTADLDPAEGVALSARLIEDDPLDESALRSHLAWLTAGGQHSRARQVYAEFVRRLDQDLGLAPTADLQALQRSLGQTAAPTVERVAAATMAPSPGFIGRAVELRRIADLLARPECRLLTVVGPGGVGKTRLMREALNELGGRHAGDAAFVALEDIAVASDLGGRIARELGIALRGSGEAMAQVAAAIGDRPMLLVLDNFEQLAPSASLLETLLAVCPRLQLMVTSRVRLALASEQVLTLEGLPCPEVEDIDCLDAFDAVRLFVQTAQRMDPAFSVTRQAAAVIDICRQLEGVPLALELAATWTRVLPCDAIAAELRGGTELLQAVDPARPARHASMEVVFEQSWRLLVAAERQALARLSTFRGGFTAEAARTVAAASLPVLAALTDKSLLRKADGRIHMHPLVQQLASLRLDEKSGDAIERSHALHFQRFLSELRRRIDDGDREALAAADVEYENCRAALRWTMVHGPPDALKRSAATLLQFCEHRGRFAECLGFFREMLDAPLVQESPHLHGLLLGWAAHLEYRLDRYAVAQATAREALAVSRDDRDHDTRLQCLKVLGACALRLGDEREARRHFEQAMQQARASADPYTHAAMLDNLALVEKSLGRHAKALKLANESLVQHQRLGDIAGEALCHSNLGALYIDQHEYAAAGAHLREALELAERHGLAQTRALTLANLTEVAMQTDDAAGARVYANRALELAESAGNRAVACWLKLQFVRMDLRDHDCEAARKHLAESLKLAVAIGQPVLQMAGVSAFADVLAALGERHAAGRVLAYARGHAATSPALRSEIEAQIDRLDVGRGQGADVPFALDELIQRIVVEQELAHAPLIAALRPAA